jgi:hypothetical protein
VCLTAGGPERVTGLLAQASTSFGCSRGRPAKGSSAPPGENAGMTSSFQPPAPPGPPGPAPQPPQPRNPLHGLTLEGIVSALAAHYGWVGLGERVPVRCFVIDPSVASSLKFLRKTPWAREKVESLYLFMLREQRRAGPPNTPPGSGQA